MKFLVHYNIVCIRELPYRIYSFRLMQAETEDWGTRGLGEWGELSLYRFSNWSGITRDSSGNDSEDPVDLVSPNNYESSAKAAVNPFHSGDFKIRFELMNS